MLYLPLSTFRRCVADHRGEHKVKDFSCLDQFFAMAFAQLTYRESLRDIEVNLRAQARRLYHMGFRCQTISRNTLANANATRPWQIYADFAQHSDRHGAAAVCQRAVWSGTRRRGLCVRRQHHRPVSVGVCLGPVSLDQGRHQAAHPAGPAGQHPQLHSHHRWQDARGQCAGRLWCWSPARFT